MRVPLSWLREYVEYDGSVEELAELLTMSGTEVEGVEWVGAPREGENLTRFVVGRVLTRDKHPNADKLSLCTVDVGESNGGVRQIVCGAQNFAAGDTVAVSLTGAVLAGGMKLRKSAIRGVESDGMMMSEKELGFEEQSPGILRLPGDWRVGAPLQEYLPVSEAVLELELTSNRPDCFSIYGIAREVAAASGARLLAPPIAAPTSAGEAAAAAIAVRIDDADLCSRYAVRVTRGVTIADSPPWLKARLTHAGMRPINNVVDVTNYVMLGYGQPLHAFDAGKIAGSTLIARRAKAGERIVTLDGVERPLDAEMLVIADVEKPLVIAGVFGAVDAEVGEQTRDIVLEAANFSGPSIMRTEMLSGIRSEASNRFEKGIDAELVPGGLDFASRLFAELCGGSVAPGVVEAVGEQPAPRRLSYRPARAEALLGYAVPAAEQMTLLRRLECTVEAAGAADEAAAETWSIGVPSFRPDLEREVDVIEEIGRLAGYGRAPETLPKLPTSGGLTKRQRVRRLARAALAASGLDEAITYTFVGPEALAPFSLGDGDVRLDPVRLSNPMSVEQSVMRTSLLPGLLATLRENVARLNDPPNLFEIGHVYLWDDEASPAPAHAAAAGVMLPHEPEQLALVLSAPLQPASWTAPARRLDFYTLKGVVEALFSALAVSAEYEALTASAGEPAAGAEAPPPAQYLHPGKATVVKIRGRRVGVLGELRADVAAACGSDDLALFVAELDFDRFAELALPKRGFSDLGAYPPATQDLAIVVAADVPAAAVVAAVRKAGGKLTQSVEVFDVYEGDQVPAGKRSLGLRVVMRSPDRTLSEKDIAGVRSKLTKALTRDFGAELRE